VAAIEMARVMMASGFQPKCSIRFVTFAAEEFGLWGSKAYAQMADNTDMDIRLMINHDMIANTNPNPDDPRVLLMPYDGFMQHTDHAAAITSQYTPLVPVYGSLNLSASDSYSSGSGDFRLSITSNTISPRCITAITTPWQI
jgi:Zn-dependent M28 family amino/carboxypeptidase